MSRPRPARASLLAAGFATLAIGALAGLVRIGWPRAPAPIAAIEWHGPLLVGGFYGALIALERAVAVAKRWTYLAPLCAAGGALAVAFGADVRAGALVVTFGSAVFVASSVVVFLRQRAAFTAMLLGGALAWLVASVMWLVGRPVPELVPWWMSFLALTIAGERLEMSRLAPIPKLARTAFVVAGALALIAPLVSARLFGLTLVLLALWIGRFDAARRTLRARGLPRFMAVSLFSAWAWLCVAGLVVVGANGFVPGPLYDAAIHATFLGFGLSMVFGHAPVVLPAVVGVPLPYRRAMYAPLALLHASVALRIACDLFGWFDVRRYAGLGNASAIVLFVVTAVACARARRPQLAFTPLPMGQATPVPPRPQ